MTGGARLNLDIISWNVLAPMYVLPERYRGCDPTHLGADTRRAQAIERIAGWSGVVQLQEVDEAFAAALGQCFAGERHVAFACKQGRSEGCACIIDAERVVTPATTFGYDDNTGHIAQLITIAGPRGVPLVVCNTHLKWDPPSTPAARRIGLAQAAKLIAHLDTSDVCDCVVTGDFNCLPDDDILACFTASGFRDIHAGSTAATCVANGRARRIDFILVRGRLEALPMPTFLAVHDQDSLPSAALPSDHAPIGAVLS